MVSRLLRGCPKPSVEGQEEVFKTDPGKQKQELTVFASLVCAARCAQQSVIEWCVENLVPPHCQ